MQAKDIRFNTVEASKLIGVSIKTLRKWCKTGQLKATKNERTSEWIISGRDFATFLYLNPRYQTYFRSISCLGPRETKRQIILRDIANRPFIYHTHLLSDIFHVDSKTVKYWMKHGYLPTMKQCAVYGEKLFSEKDVSTFLSNCPRYLKPFESYLQTKKYI